jgi:hypothetical protein
VLGCLAKRPAERPKSAGEVARALLAIEREIEESIFATGGML